MDATRRERGAALVVALSGLMVLIGSFQPWDTCPKFPCEGSFGFMSLFSRAGVDIGWGVLTAVVGLLLAIAGVASFRRPERFPFRTGAITVALCALGTVGVYIARTFVVPEFFTYGPNAGVYLVAGAAATAIMAGANLRPDRQRPDYASQRG